MTSSESKLQKVQTHFQALSEIASSLNSASDELTKVVGVLDEALKKLNVGLTVWVTFIEWGCEEPSDYDQEQVGYCKVNGTWGIALRHIWGDHLADNHSQDGPWLFNDAPRDMRLQGVDKLPELIEALSNEALKTANKIQEKTEEVRHIAAAVAETSKLPKTTALYTVNISRDQVAAIIEGVRKSQKFVAELLEHAHFWERQGNELRIRFAPEKNTFAGLLGGRDSSAKLNNVVNQVLGIPTKVLVMAEPPRFPRTATNTNTTTERGQK